jgi:hypothetical protein
LFLKRDAAPLYPLDKASEKNRSFMALAEIDRTAEHMRASPNWREPTEEQKADGRRAFEEAIADIRARRQAVRDFSDKVERERAELE